LSHSFGIFKSFPLVFYGFFVEQSGAKLFNGGGTGRLKLLRAGMLANSWFVRNHNQSYQIQIPIYGKCDVVQTKPDTRCIYCSIPNDKGSLVANILREFGSQYFQFLESYIFC